ncbi:Crp/Fnr family transcriptional regulator [Flavobacteriaceae bacterium F08102]|nr:Crp/Fnr family transcriptional regulator [Flavobacteriaceae bacterium F08102]
MSPENPHYIRFFEELKFSFFENKLGQVEIRDLLSYMNSEHWPAGTYKSSTEVNNHIHFIISGRLKVFQINPITGKAYTIFMLAGGDVFDIMNILDDEKHEINWETIDDVELLNIPIEHLRKCLQLYPDMNMLILKYLGKQMRMLEDEVTDISLHNTLTRLSNLLLKHINEKTKELELINNLPNDEIASLIGTTRAVVNRHIQELKKCGAIKVKRKRIDVSNIELLLAIAEEKHLP